MRQTRAALTIRTKINEELDDLQARDPLLPPDADATGALEVVPVHDDVDGQVQADDHPGDRGVSDQLRVAENSGSAMVVAVEEGWRRESASGDPAGRGVGLAGCRLTERLLLQEQEDGVQELEVLGQVVELGRTVSTLVPARRAIRVQHT